MRRAILNLVVAHINERHGCLTRENMWVGRGELLRLVSNPPSFDRGERVKSSGSHFLRSDNFGSSRVSVFIIS